jgi:hypothetical protein
MRFLPIICLTLLSQLSLPRFAAAQAAKQPKPGRPKRDTTTISMRVIARNYGDSIAVRWAPGSSAVWMSALRTGYLLKRKVLTREDKYHYHLVDSSSMTILPWTLDEWGSYFKASADTQSTAAAELVYGKKMPFSAGKEGRSMSSILDKYNEQQNKFLFAMVIADFSPGAARGLGLRWVDHSVKKGYHYLYSVIPLTDRRLFRADTGRVLVDGSRIDPRDSFPSLAAKAGDRTIHLFWSNLVSIRRFSGFIIERSDDGHQFIRLTKFPFIPARSGKNLDIPVDYGDSVQKDNTWYYYRVSGVDAFGDFSLPSSVLRVKALDLTPPHYPIITDIKNIPGTKKIWLKWLKKEKEPDFKGYVVGRSTSMRGPFEPLTKTFLPFDSVQFTDNHPNLHESNYYIVAAVDTAGNSGRSMPAFMDVADNEPPAKPQGLSGAIDDSGRVQLHWKWGSDPDLAGYRVYFSNAPDHVFDCLNPEMLTDTAFSYIVGLHTLTRKIYYKVIAYDRNKNASLPSDMLMLTKPDKVPPVTAGFYGFHVSDTAVLLHWAPGGSKDAARQLVYRQTDMDTSWGLVATLNGRDSGFADRTVSSRHYYTYAIETMDSSGLRSGKSFPLKVYVYAGIATDSIRNFSATPGQDGATCQLNWSAPAIPPDYYILYREFDNGGLRMAADIPGNISMYTDKIRPGKYRYALKAIYRKGIRPAMSEIKSIDLQ